MIDKEIPHLSTLDKAILDQQKQQLASFQDYKLNRTSSTKFKQVDLQSQLSQWLLQWM